jgi:hypothetical protein
MCVYPHTQSGTSPAGFTVQLNQSNTATLRWNPVQGATGYRLVASTFDGRPARTSTFAPGQTMPTDDTGGVATCYVVQTLFGASNVGATNTVCAVPGIASPRSATSGADAVLDRISDRLRHSLSGR